MDFITLLDVNPTVSRYAWNPHDSAVSISTESTSTDDQIAIQKWSSMYSVDGEMSRLGRVYLGLEDSTNKKS